MSRTIFIGDVHGCLGELEALVGRLNLDLGDRLIFVGDLVDKGPDSLGVLRFVRVLTETYEGSVVVSGNHEEKASRFAKRGKWVEPWAEQATAEDWAFIDAMPLTWNDPELNVRVVHGGIFPALLQKHPDVWERIEARGDKWQKGGGKVMSRARRMLRIRYVGGPQRPEGVKGEVPPGEMLELGTNVEGDPFWAETYEGPMVIYGHSPWLDGQVRRDPCALGIDTGCVFGGKLTAVVMEPGGPSYGTVSVDAQKQHAKPLEGVD
jgi:diadenosine tetraphosphatase ApaH/serine/threonine PP2A family protein phosphatase